MNCYVDICFLSIDIKDPWNKIGFNSFNYLAYVKYQKWLSHIWSFTTLQTFIWENWSLFNLQMKTADNLYNENKGNRNMLKKLNDAVGTSSIASKCI